MPKDYQRILLVRAKDGSERSKGILIGIIRDTLYWNLGQTRCTWDPEEWDILKDLNYESDHDLNRVNRDVDIFRCPEPSEPVARLGWISPEGHYFPCAYCAHKDLADLLFSKYGKRTRSCLESGENALIKDGWLAIKGGFPYKEWGTPWPQPMLDTYEKLVFAFEEAEKQEVNFNRSLLQNFEDYYVSDWMTPPNGQGDIVQQLRRNYDDIVCMTDRESEKTRTSPSLLPPVKLQRRPDEHPGD